MSMIINPYMFGGGGGGTDPDFANVVALLHFDGSDGGTTFTDQTGKIWTATGHVQIDTAQFKFGDASALFDGVDDELSYPNSADFGFGTGDFTFEAWVRRQNADCVIFDNRSGPADTASIVFYISEDGNLCYYDTTVKTGSGAAVVSASTWTHVAWCRSSGTVRMFVSGILVFTGAKANSMGASRPMRIGRDVVGNADFSGHIDDVRITNGVGRYSANFTPPAGPFPNS